jgi:virginiamycin B lyase
MWFTDTSANTIGLIDGAGQVTEYPITSSKLSGPIGIAEGPDQAMWFTAYGIGRIDRRGGGSAYGLPRHPPPAPQMIALGADGNLWFTDHRAVGRAVIEG